ncbi:hypothetical protein SAMN02745146_0094 [Hymenobacter daecheongensis DSM 21074]|uniref:DUF2586 family protein n=1 Tax=Hymenobacter daecheongensis DSM 21074 TaxID=1121955 RepID=A0A1M6LXQ9_9BACT|nr:DUF2586 family protein [Hymenobacter daecheongensis]SHJ75976.1 hypothetical protein SAMN02745146_0094 [Hymenobacter daecheongensis DSM 21074]
MNEFQGPLISKPRGRLGRRNPSADGTIGLVAGGVAATGLALGAILRLIQPEDAEAVGINAAYDANNNVLVYHHIRRIFHYNPDATLYLMLAPQAASLATICNPTGDYLRKLLQDDATKGEIRKAGVVLNPVAAPAAGEYTTGLLSDVLTAIPQAQALVVALAASAIYIDNIMLGGILSPTASVATLPNLRASASENVSVCIAADPAVLLATGRAYYAEVGSALGMLSIRKVSECLGSVDIARKPEAAKGKDTYPLTSTATGYFLSAALSNGKPFGALFEAEKAALGTKGYIYAGRFQGLDGVYFNESHTCTEAASDYAYIEDNGVWNKATRNLREALLPVLRGEVDVDAATGFLSGGQVAYYQAKGAKAVGTMAAAKEISGEPVVRIEPSQNVVGTGTVKMSLAYVRRGILRQLEAEVGAINPAAG